MFAMWSLWIHILLLHTSLIQISIGKPTLSTRSIQVTSDTTDSHTVRVGDMLLDRSLFHSLRKGIDNVTSQNSSTQHKNDFNKVRVGDMVLERDLFDWLRGGGAEHSDEHRIIRRKIVRQRLWPFNSTYGVPTIPYVLEGSVSRYEDIIKQAIEHWNKHTCINFRPKRKHDTHYVKLNKGDGCWSQVGRSPDVGGQEVSIGEGCQRVPTVIHELGHAVGLIHEHQRPDRDDYIHVNWGNIDDDSVDQFTKWDNYVVKRLDVPYDYTSVMQYGPLGFTKSGGLSMSTIPPKYQGLIGRHEGLSHRDKRAVNLAYGCIDMWSANCLFEDCEDEGFMGPDCKCVCPPGRSGDHCQHTDHDYYTLPRCSRVIKEETTLSSPNYPGYIEPDTWCVYEITAPEGFVPLLTFRDFYLYGWGIDCSDDLLQIRHSNQYDGDVFCGRLDSGTQVLGSVRTMVMYMEVKTSHSPGFQAQITWANASSSPTVVNPKPGDGGPGSGIENLLPEIIHSFIKLFQDMFHSFMSTMFDLIIKIFLAFKFIQGNVGVVYNATGLTL